MFWVQGRRTVDFGGIDENGQRLRQRLAASGLRCFTAQLPCRYTSPGAADCFLEPPRRAEARGRSMPWYLTALTGLASCDAA